MSMLYKQEHTSCCNYLNYEKPTIEFRKVSKNEQGDFLCKESLIVLIMKGKFSFSTLINPEESVSKGIMIMLSAGNTYQYHIKEDVEILLFRLNTYIKLCDQYSMEKLHLEHSDSQESSNKMKITPKINHFTSGLTQIINDGFRCKYFHELKLKEFLYLLRAYYTKKELAGFFYDYLSSDMNFSNFIIQNHSRVKTVEEFAILGNYSISRFEKQFKKVFGVPAYQWMLQKKSEKILRDIGHSEKSIKDICHEYGFSSLSQFSTFCKRCFGLSPSKLRKKHV